jgi:hypothetical protein
MMKPFRAPRKAKELAKPPERESEAPTELGVVRERHIIKETEEEDMTARTVAVEDILFDADSDDDDVPIVATLPPRPSNLSLLAMAATQKRSKKAPKQLWTYETVSEPTGIVSKYWDSPAPKERETKRAAKQKLSDLTVVQPEGLGKTSLHYLPLHDNVATHINFAAFRPRC